VLLVTSSHLLHKLRLDEVDELGYDSQNFWFPKNVWHISIGFDVIIEIISIVDFFILGLSNFLDLVVVNVELFTIKDRLVKGSFGSWGFFWWLEANEGVDSFIFFGE